VNRYLNLHSSTWKTIGLYGVTLQKVVTLAHRLWVLRFLLVHRTNCCCYKLGLCDNRNYLVESARTHAHKYIYTHTHTRTYIVYVCVCVCIYIKSLDTIGNVLLGTLLTQYVPVLNIGNVQSDFLPVCHLA
jgi:hypothetical protein